MVCVNCNYMIYLWWHRWAVGTSNLYQNNRTSRVWREGFDTQWKSFLFSFLFLSYASTNFTHTTAFYHFRHLLVLGLSLIACVVLLLKRHRNFPDLRVYFPLSARAHSWFYFKWKLNRAAPHRALLDQAPPHIEGMPKSSHVERIRS